MEKDLWGGIAVHFRGKRKFDSFLIALYFWARQFDSFPMWGRIYREGKYCIKGEESVTPSPCEEGFVGKDSCAFMVEEF